MRVAVIVNPVAGASKQGPELRAMLRRLRSAGMQVDWQPTGGPGDARQFALDASRQADAVVTVGGDGTVREVVEGLTGSGVPMVIWPTGTENLVAKSLGFRPTADSILSSLTAGKTTDLDLGLANGRSFLVVAGIGFDAEIVQRLSHGRAGHITHLSYSGPIWRAFWEHKFPLIRVIADGRTQWEGRGLAFVGNMARYSLGLRVVRDAVPDDGLLDLLVLPCQSRTKLLAHSARAIVRRHVEYGGAIYTRFTQIRIESPDTVPVELDGDVGGCLPMDFEIRPAAVHVKLPPKS